MMMQQAFALRMMCRKFSQTVALGSKNVTRQMDERRYKRYIEKSKKAFIDATDYRKFPVGPSMPESLRVSASSGRGPSRPGSDRRARYLSAIFHEYTSSLVESGEVCPQLVELGFHITKVEVSSDLSVMSVYWLPFAEQHKNDILVSLLPTAASELRAALISLRVVSQAPGVRFVKDMAEGRIDEVERLLKIADMGSDEDFSDQNIKTESEEIQEAPLSVKSIQEEIEMVAHRMEKGDLIGRRRPDGTVEIGGEENLHEEKTLNNETEQTSRRGVTDESFVKYGSHTPRNDIYGVDYDKLIKKVKIVKRKDS